MAKEKFCPRCGGDITDSYEEEDTDVGIMRGGWYCDACEYPVPVEDDYYDVDDVEDRS